MADGISAPAADTLELEPVAPPLVVRLDASATMEICGGVIEIAVHDKGHEDRVPGDPVNSHPIAALAAGGGAGGTGRGGGLKPNRQPGVEDCVP